MPTRLLIPVVGFIGIWTVTRTIYHNVRYKQKNWTRERNERNIGVLDMPGQDRPGPRKYQWTQKHKNKYEWQTFGKWAKGELCFKKLPKKLTQPLPDPDPEKPLYQVRDVLLARDLLTGTREKQLYEYYDFTIMPKYYQRWQRRTKEIFEKQAQEKKMAQFIFVLLLVGVMVVSYAGGVYFVKILRTNTL